MPYLFVFLLIANIATLGYFLFLHDSANADTTNVTLEKAKIERVIEVSKAKDN